MCYLEIGNSHGPWRIRNSYVTFYYDVEAHFLVSYGSILPCRMREMLTCPFFRGLCHMPFSRMNKEQHPHSYGGLFLGNVQGNVSEKIMSNCESYYTLNHIALVNSKQGGGGGRLFHCFTCHWKFI